MKWKRCGAVAILPKNLEFIYVMLVIIHIRCRFAVKEIQANLLKRGKRMTK